MAYPYELHTVGDKKTTATTIAVSHCNASSPLGDEISHLPFLHGKI
jgi:hypothetical protein